MLIFAEDEAPCFDAPGHSLRYEPRVASMLDVTLCRLAFKSSPVATLKQRRPRCSARLHASFPSSAGYSISIAWQEETCQLEQENLPVGRAKARWR